MDFLGEIDDSHQFSGGLSAKIGYANWKIGHLSMQAQIIFPKWFRGGHLSMQ